MQGLFDTAVISHIQPISSFFSFSPEYYADLHFRFIIILASIWCQLHQLYHKIEEDMKWDEIVKYEKEARFFLCPVHWWFIYNKR